jgi:hypothetical protein
LRPFAISEAAGRLLSVYPTADDLRQILKGLERSEQESFLRLWVSEGIPSVFGQTPMFYDSMRVWLGRRLDVNPKAITVIGSARFGYSLSKAPKFGTPFNSERSDLDISIVSAGYFTTVTACFDTWLDDYHKGSVAPKNDKENYYWSKNASEVPEQIRRGFIDAHKTPNRERYAVARKSSEAMFQLAKKIENTEGMPNFSKITIRTYRDWDAFLKQQLLNLNLLINSI